MKSFKYEIEIFAPNEGQARSYLSLVRILLATEVKMCDTLIDQAQPHEVELVRVMNDRGVACERIAHAFAATLAETREAFAKREGPEMAKLYGERFGKGRK